MADPFSIVGVISTADVVFTRLFKYIKGVKRAEKEILDLAAEVKRLYWTLQSVRTAAEDLKDLNGHAPLVDPKHISDCVTTLDELRQLLSKYQPEAEAEADLSIRTVKARWMWPIDKSKALDLKRKVHDHNISFTTSLSANGLSMMVAMLSNAESSASTLEKVSKLLEASAQIELHKTTRELLSVVGPTRPVAYQKTNAQLHHPGTGIWFIESDEFRWWLETQNSKLWVFGIPGAGKSVLAATAIEKALAYANSDNAVAYFYCDYKDPETQDPVKILGSLAEQIARQDSRSFDKLKAFVHAHTHDKDLQTFITNEEELYNLVIAMAENFETTMIIVDGLDECEDVRRTTRCLTLLSEGSARIKTFLSSRKIVDVEDFMSDYKRISIAARSSDLRLYVAAEMENRMKPSNVRRLRIKDPSLKGEIMDKLINGADGMFRWVAVQLDSFCEMPSDFDIREALNTLPRGLFPSYERVLDRISRKHPLTQRLVQCALKWITYCNMEVPALLEALAVTEDTRQLKNLRKYEVQDILLHCESLVRLSSDEYKVELAHFTVKEFLTSVDTTARPDLSSYKLNFESDRQYLAATCLTFLCCGDFDICLREEELASRHHEHPFRPQAVVKWVNLARDCTESPSVRQPLMRLFGPQSTRLVTSWAQEYLFELFGFRSINPSGFFGSRIRWKSFTPLHWAAMMRLPDVCRSLTCVPGQTQAGSSFGTPLQMALVGCQCYCVAQQGSREASLSYGFDAEIEDIFLLETVQVLIDHGADVDGNWVHQDGVLSMTPLVMTLLTQEWYSFRLLLRAGAKCGIVVIEKLIEYLDSSEFECDDTGLMSIVDSISEQEIAHGAKEAFSRMKAKFCTLSPSVDMPSGALQILSQAADVEAQLELVLDSARFNNEKSMTSLLEGLSIDCNSKNHAGESALMLAARHCNVPILRMLLEHGAELEIADEKGRTPLHHAVKSGMPEAVEFLLMTGANPLLCDHRDAIAKAILKRYVDLETRDLEMADDKHCVNALECVFWSPCGNALFEIILESAGSFDSKTFLGASLLHLAASAFYLDRVELLLSKGLDPNERDHGGSIALHYACYAQRVESATLLLTAGADPWLLNSNGVSSVQLAIQHGWLGFLQSIPVEGGRWGESCPLQLPHGLRAIKLHHAAAVYSQLECLKFLLGLSQYFKLEEQTDDGCTLLEIAVQRRCQPIVTYLLQSGATPHRARDGNTALHTAAEFGDLEIVNALLKHGFDPLEPGSHGRTPLSIAKTLNWTEVVSVIEAFIADKSIFSISQGQCGSVRAEKKTTPTTVSNSPRRELKLHKSLTLSVNRDCPDSRVAHAQGSLDMRKRRGPQGHHLISIEDLLGVEISPELPNDLELTKGVNVSMLLGVGAHTALQCAAYNANVEAIRLLLEHGARVNQESSIYLDTALSIAARRPDSEAVCALLDYGASIHHFPSDSESCACSIRLAHSQVSGEKLIQSNLFRLPCCLDRRTLISELAASSRVLELYEAVGHPHEMIEPDGLGWTALHSCWNRGPAVMKAYILNSGLDLSGRTRCFGSALNYHWYDFNHGLLRRLLRRLGREQSLDMLNVKPEHRDTPLYAASAMGQIKILRLLLVSGADLDLIGGQMGTPLIAAASYGRLHIVKELISAGAGFSCFCPALGEVVNVFDQARDFPDIQRWLLVGRWMERSCIGWVGSTC
ncbi:Ankyrin repeat-containing protein [Cladophialophora immunda]|nr:Ankyrin repeat-containing protein [Cladophialophora immunda]